MKLLLEDLQILITNDGPAAILPQSLSDDMVSMLAVELLCTPCSEIALHVTGAYLVYQHGVNADLSEEDWQAGVVQYGDVLWVERAKRQSHVIEAARMAA